MHTRVVEHGSRMARTGRAVLEFVADERGDDLIEYAMLTTAIGLVGVAAFNYLRTQILNAYSSWDTTQQVLAPPPDPK